MSQPSQLRSKQRSRSKIVVHYIQSAYSLPLFFSQSFLCLIFRSLLTDARPPSLDSLLHATTTTTALPLQRLPQASSRKLNPHRTPRLIRHTLSHLSRANSLLADDALIQEMVRVAETERCHEGVRGALGGAEGGLQMKLRWCYCLCGVVVAGGLEGGGRGDGRRVVRKRGLGKMLWQDGEEERVRRGKVRVL